MDQPSTGTDSILRVARLLLVSTWGMVSCGGPAEEGSWDGDGILAIEGALVFTSPSVPPIEDGVVVVIDGVIEAVGERGRVQVPTSATRIPGAGLSVVAGFWNAHVRLPAEWLTLETGGKLDEIEELFREWFSRFGFTTLVETGTPRAEVTHLVEMLQSGQLQGPRVISVGDGLVSGVHFPAPGEPPWTDEVLSQMLSEDVAIVPGLGLLSGDDMSSLDTDLDTDFEERRGASLEQLRTFSLLGGRLIFGTGAGHVPRYDPIADHLLLEEAGLSFADRLAALTTEPAARFGVFRLGEVEPGMVADLVLIEGDPEVDVTAFERIRWVLREGRPIFP